MFCRSNWNTRPNKLSHAHPFADVRPLRKNVNSDFSRIKSSHVKQPGEGIGAGKEMCSNFSAIPTQLTRKGPLGANRPAFGTEAHEGLELKMREKEWQRKWSVMAGSG